MWHEGKIDVPKKAGGHTTIHFWMKAYDEPSEYGIENGKISKLMLKQNGKIVYNFDRGLDVPPKTEEAETALAILMQEYN